MRTNDREKERQIRFAKEACRRSGQFVNVCAKDYNGHKEKDFYYFRLQTALDIHERNLRYLFNLESKTPTA